MCVVLFYQTEWFNNRSEKSSENCFQFSFVVLFCVQYLFLVASSLQPAGQWFLRSFSLHASRSPSLGSPRGLRPVESLVLIFCLLLARLQDLRRKWWLDEARRKMRRFLPGRSTSVSRPQTSSRRHCRTLHSSWGLRTEWPAASWRKTRIRPRQPGRIMLCNIVVVVLSPMFPPGVTGLCGSIINKVWRSALVIRQKGTMYVIRGRGDLADVRESQY